MPLTQQTIALLSDPTKKIEEIIAALSDINDVDESGATLLHCAITHKRYDVALALLDREGLDITAKDNNGRTVLHRLAMPKVDNKTVLIPWLMATAEKDLLIQKFLILPASRACINDEDKDQDTPLTLAMKAWSRDERLISILLELGANYYTVVPGTDGLSVLDYAVENQLIDLLVGRIVALGDMNAIQKVPKEDKEAQLIMFMRALMVGNTKLAGELLEQGRITQVDLQEEQEQISAYAVGGGHIASLEWLLSQGLLKKDDFFSVTDLGLPLYAVAFLEGKRQVVQWLLEKDFIDQKSLEGNWSKQALEFYIRGAKTKKIPEAEFKADIQAYLFMFCQKIADATKAIQFLSGIYGLLANATVDTTVREQIQHILSNAAETEEESIVFINSVSSLLPESVREETKLVAKLRCYESFKNLEAFIQLVEQIQKNSGQYSKLMLDEVNFAIANAILSEKLIRVEGSLAIVSDSNKANEQERAKQASSFLLGNDHPDAQHLLQMFERSLAPSFWQQPISSQAPSEPKAESSEPKAAPSTAPRKTA